MASIAKVNRARMFNLRETEVITEFMKINLCTLKASHAQGGPGAAQKVSKIWERLTEEVNACGNGPRTCKQVKEKWRNMVKTAKSDVSAEKCSMRKTGGGPARPEMSQQSQSVASLFQTSASFHGVCSDADTVITNQDFDDSTYDNVDDNLLSSDLLSLCPLETLTKDVQDNMNMPSISVTADESFERQPRPNYPEGTSTNAPSQTSSAMSQHTSNEKSKHKNITQQKRTLKDLQMTFYERQIQLSEAQMECYNKFSQLADVLIEKYKID